MKPEAATQESLPLQPNADKPIATLSPPPPPSPAPILPASKRAPFVVAPDGSGTHCSISAAISAAVPGDTIKIKGGVYEEALFVTAPLVFIGLADALVIIHHPTFAAVTVRQADVVFENIAFALRQDHEISFVAESSVLRFTACCFAPIEELARNLGAASLCALFAPIEELARNLNAASLCALITQLKAGAAQAKQSCRPRRMETGPPSFNSLKFTGGSVSIKASILINTDPAGTHFEFKLEDSTLVGSRLFVGEASTAHLFSCEIIDSGCVFHGGATAMLLCCRFSQIYHFAVFCDASTVEIIDSEFEGGLKRIERVEHYDGGDPEGPIELNPRFMVIPKSLYSIVGPIFDEINTKLGEKYRNGDPGDGFEVMGRFLGTIGITDGSAKFPSYLHNGVLEKLFWEYRRKYGSLSFPPDNRQLLTQAEVMRPLSGTEREEFLNTLARKSVECSGDHIGIEAKGIVSLRLKNTKMTLLRIAILSTHSEGVIKIEGCSFFNNVIGVRNDNFSMSVGSKYLFVENTRFENHYYRGISYVCSYPQKEKLGVITLETCRFNRNSLGVVASGVKVDIRKCEFTDNRENASLELLAWGSVVVTDCKGIGESAAFQLFQKAKQLWKRL
jgi:hypothetical protein